MSDPVDILFVKPGDHKQIYQDLGDEFSAIEPPAFAGLFATYSRLKKHRVALFDIPAMKLSAEQAVKGILENYDPLLVALTVYGLQPSASTQNMDSAGKVARFIKEQRPDIKILMTGTHPAALPSRTMFEEAVDFVCDLEGPVTIHKVAQALKGGATDFSRIPSLWWRDDSGQIIPPKSTEPLVKDLDHELPGIAWDLMPMDKYRAHNWHCFTHIDDRSPYVSIHTSLGCPYSCSFCCINAPFGKSSYRLWSPESVVREIDFLVETHGVKNIKFVDEMFVLNRKHVLGICDLLIQRDYQVNIWAYARVDTIQEDMLEKLKAAGINWLALGIESSSTHVRNGAEKKIRNSDIRDVVRRVKDAGIYIIGNYIFGLPDDSLERMQNTLDLALDLKCEFANFYSAMAYPGSSLYDVALEKKIKLPETWAGYSQHSYETLPLANEFCAASEILAFREHAFKSYFTHKPYLDMIRQNFGDEVVDHIDRMISIPIRRKLLE